MGWSCSQKAGNVLDKISEGCVKITGSQNMFVSNGARYFFETSRREHRDGSITGEVCKIITEKSARKVGSFRINGDGTIARMPKAMRQVGGI